MADDYDFQIDSMKFRAASSDQFPYGRETAPFRKEQFDSTPTVGDQSLTGWWTRGQLSFHKGAGVKYLDLQQGDTLNTFWYGKDINVMTPGEVSPVYTPAASHKFACNAAVIVQFPTTTGYEDAWFVDGNGTHRISGTGSMSALSQTDLTASGSADPMNVCVDYGYAYVGMSDGSVERADGSASATSVLWSHAGDPNEEIVYDNARDRLWVINWETNKTCLVYMLDTIGGSFTTADAVSTVPFDSNYGLYAVCVPSGLLTASGNRIMLLSVSEDGTPSPAVQVAETNTPITALGYHSGQVIIGTRDGIRLGELNGTELIYGPAFGPTYDNGTGLYASILVDRIVGYAGKAYVGCRYYIDQTPNTGVIHSGILQLNLDDQQDLVPSWSEWVVNEEGGSALFNVSTPNLFRNGVAYTYDGEFIQRPTTTATTSAYLVTGYHRLGTLEPKRFGSVTVKAQGLRGSITVSAIDATGSATNLGTLTITHTGAIQVVEQEFDMPSTLSERFALKFSWASDGTTSAPQLTGYQLRALPAPKRQRVLRWPLVIQDHILLRRGTTVGKKGRAYSDITTLEALETSAAVVTFTDHRTGETGSAYLDSVEFQADTPSTANTHGFGGVAYVTLRVLP